MSGICTFFILSSQRMLSLSFSKLLPIWLRISPTPGYGPRFHQESIQLRALTVGSILRITNTLMAIGVGFGYFVSLPTSSFSFGNFVTPIREVLRSRGVPLDDQCPYCTTLPKTMGHCFSLCPRAAQVWFHFGLVQVMPSFFERDLLPLWTRDTIQTHGSTVAIIL